MDLHCHLDLYPDYPALVLECERLNVWTLGVTTTPQAWPRNRDLADATKHVRAALGLHPQLVGERQHELRLWERYLPEARYIGEVGLDASPKYYASFEAQKAVFRSVLQACAAVGGRVITVHSVRSAQATLDLIEEELPADRGRVVMHWFSGSRSEADRAVALGCFFSVNTVMLDGERGRRLVSAIPRDRILTETDGPFTAIEQRAARPGDVANTVATLSRVLGASSDDVRAMIQENLRRLLAVSDARPR